MKRADDDDLQQYLDGELDPGAAREVEARVAAAPELAGKLDALRQLREVVRARMAAATDEADARLGTMWARIEQGLGAAPAGERAARAPRGLFAVVKHWFEGHRGYIVTGAVSAAAGAIIATLALREPPRPAGPPPPAEAARAEDTEVESLEVSGGTGTIFQIAGSADEAATTVIWVTQDDGDQVEPAEGPI